MVQSVSKNHLGGTDRTTNIYNFTGQALASRTTQTIPNKPTQSVLRNFDYDNSMRLIKTWHTIGSGTKVLLAMNKYNEVGQLIDKKLHNTDPVSTPDASRTFKQSIDYRYNIRGWLTSINNSTLDIQNNNDDLDDLFGMNLLYQNSDVALTTAPQFNGNISAVKWSNELAKGAVKDFAFAYSYDTLNRIKSSKFLKDSVIWANPTNAFNEDNYGYDLNGNIMRLCFWQYLRL